VMSSLCSGRIPYLNSLSACILKYSFREGALEGGYIFDGVDSVEAERHNCLALLTADPLTTGKQTRLRFYKEAIYDYMM
jgi:hypothetical protein